MNWHQILTISITDKYALRAEAGFTLLLILFLVGVIFLISKFFSKRNNVFSTEIELNINLGGIGSMKIKQNGEVAQIAHRAWTELVTRKAGLPIDIEHDVISEIYDSWYVLFDRIRELVKNIPASQLKKNNTQMLVKILVDSLNNGLRPHLTKWQARYRRWLKFELEKEENKDKSPQEIQKLFPQYDALVSDLILINQQVVSYTNELKKLMLL